MAESERQTPSARQAQRDEGLRRCRRDEGLRWKGWADGGVCGGERGSQFEVREVTGQSERGRGWLDFLL